MARRITVKSYPLLKLTIPLAIILALIGLYLFFTTTVVCDVDLVETERCTLNETVHSYSTLTLLPWIGGAIVVAFIGLLYRKKETVTVLLPSDTLAEHSRSDLQKLLAGLDEAKAKGELTEERYIKARDRVLSEMKK